MVFKMKTKNFIIISIISFIILSIILLSFYPGIVPYDGNYQWQQVKSGIITNAHPFFSTYFMFLLSKLWNSVTVVVIYQIILVSISWGYLCKCIKVENRKQILLMYIYTIFVMLSPLISIYSITVWKDIIYTSYLFICAIMLFEWSSNNYSLSSFKYTLLGIVLSMIYSYRHNGIVVAILIIIVVYINCITKYLKKMIKKSNFIKCFYVLLSFVVILVFISIPKEIILDQSNKKIDQNAENEISYSAIDSYMLWMMGAHVKEGNIKKDSDLNFLNNIIPISEWKQAYNPYLINDTGLTPNLNKKYLVNNNYKFRNLFIKYSIKYPGTILKHYLKSDALLLNPVSSIKGYVYVYPFQELAYLPAYTKIKPILKPIEKIYMAVINLSLHKPFIIFYQPAFILYISLILIVLLSKKVYGKKIWLFSLPMILNTISLLPINLAQDLRYVYINYWTFYGLMLIFVLNFKKVFGKK